MSSTPVVLILGAGPRIGASVASTFTSNGYNIALASRNGTGSKNAQGHLSLHADFTNPSTIPALFAAVAAEFRTAPSVVVYNAAALTPPPDPASVLSIPAQSVLADLNVNTVSAYVAAQQAVSAWDTMPTEIKKTFIYTGNILNTALVPVPLMLDLGMGKSATAYWIGVADALYAARGFRFFYADERQMDGRIKGMALDGPAHGDFYAQLAAHGEDLPWHATFVKGKGYVQFK